MGSSLLSVLISDPSLRLSGEAPAGRRTRSQETAQIRARLILPSGLGSVVGARDPGHSHSRERLSGRLLRPIFRRDRPGSHRRHQPPVRLPPRRELPAIRNHHRHHRPLPRTMIRHRGWTTRSATAGARTGSRSSSGCPCAALLGGVPRGIRSRQTGNRATGLDTSAGTMSTYNVPENTRPGCAGTPLRPGLRSISKSRTA